MTLLKDNNYKDINVALLSLEADIKNKITGSFDTSEIDKQLAEINSRIDKINAGGGSSSSDEIEDINSKLNSNSIKIRNIEQNVEDIGTQINGIEQKLSDIFSAENKVTDFNATTNSGIYYWVTDAANRPTDYGVLLVNKHDGGSSTSIWVNQVAYGTNNKIYFRQNINSGGWTEWKAVAFEGEKVSAAGTADKAVEVVDYGDASSIVRIGYHGPGVTADKLLYLAGYTEQRGDSSVKLKDVNKEEIIKWLGIPRIKYADYRTGDITFSSTTDQKGVELSNFGPDVTEDNVLSFMVIWWSGIIITASGDWAKSQGTSSSGLKCALHALSAGTGQCVIRCVYMV